MWTPIPGPFFGRYFPAKESHYFRVFKYSNRLTIQCRRRHYGGATVYYWWWDGSKVVIKPHYEPSFFFKFHSSVGHFRLTGCRGKVQISDYYSADISNTPLNEPDQTRTRDMGYDSEGATTLTLGDPEQSRILRSLDGAFHYLAEPTKFDLGQTFYPFFFQDLKRVYLAMPLSGDAPGMGPAINDPVFSMSMSKHSAMMLNIPLPDSGASDLSDPITCIVCSHAATIQHGV